MNIVDQLKTIKPEKLDAIILILEDVTGFAKEFKQMLIDNDISDEKMSMQLGKLILMKMKFERVSAEIFGDE
jgi:hypothetical protein